MPLLPRPTERGLDHDQGAAPRSSRRGGGRGQGDQRCDRTPSGSRNKYKYDAELGAFTLASVLPEGSVFPYDFGFVPSTRGADGDPLDVLVLLDAPVSMGCLLKARLIGVIEAEETEPDGKPLRNDRFLAVAVHAHAHNHVKELQDLRPRLVDEIEAFFMHYNQLHGKEFKPLRRGDSRRAMKLLSKGATRKRAS